MTLWERIEDALGICHFSNETAKCPHCGSSTDLIIKFITESAPQSLQQIYYCGGKRYFVGDHLNSNTSNTCKQVISCLRCGKEVQPIIEGAKDEI